MSVGAEIAAALSQIGGPERPDSVGDKPEQTMLVGYVVVAEWMDENGQRWLSRVAGTGTGETVPSWQLQGYLHNGLHDSWPDGEDE